MKRLTAFFLALALTLTLCACGEPIRDVNNYYVDKTENGWCVLYKDEESGEVEEIAVMGATPQPMVLEKGRFFFVQPGMAVSVDSNGEDRKELAIEGLPAGSYIAFVDEDSFYCVTEETAIQCWQIDKELVKAEKITIPRKFRSVDYDSLASQIESEIGAVDNEIRVTRARAELDSNGSLTRLGLELLSYTGDVGSMHVWGNISVEFTVTTSEPQLTVVDHMLPLSLADDTTQQELSLRDFLTALQTADTSEVAVKHQDGIPECFVIVYQDEDFEYNAGSAPVLTVDGTETERDDDLRHLVMAQVGGTADVMWDRRGNPCGNLLVLQMG